MGKPAIGFIGAGTLGSGMALGLSVADYRVTTASSRSLASAERLASLVTGCEAVATAQQVVDRCELVFITTPDEAIGKVAAEMAWRAGQAAVHCSGAESLDILDPAAAMGADTGSFHPFQTFASLNTPNEAAERLQGASIAIEGLGRLYELLHSLATDLGARPITLKPEDRALYHASAVVSCGYLAALLNAAADMWREMGVPPEQALPTILPLARGTLDSISRAGISGSVTGPVVRGDVATLERHLNALAPRLPSLLPLYCSLARASLPLAVGKASEARLDAMDRLLERYEGRVCQEEEGAS